MIGYNPIDYLNKQGYTQGISNDNGEMKSSSHAMATYERAFQPTSTTIWPWPVSLERRDLCNDCLLFVVAP